MCPILIGSVHDVKKFVLVQQKSCLDKKMTYLHEKKFYFRKDRICLGINWGKVPSQKKRFCRTEKHKNLHVKKNKNSFYLRKKEYDFFQPWAALRDWRKFWRQHLFRSCAFKREQSGTLALLVITFAFYLWGLFFSPFLFFVAIIFDRNGSMERSYKSLCWNSFKGLFKNLLKTQGNAKISL